MKLNFSSAYHHQTDGQTERVNQVLKDMLRACTLKDNQSWDKCLPYDEFSYNNSYQESIKMAPFEFLYGRKCRTPLFWNEPGENQIFRPDILREAERQVQMVRENLKLAQTQELGPWNTWQLWSCLVPEGGSWRHRTCDSTRAAPSWDSGVRATRHVTAPELP
jgi:hypothetical protein